MLLILRVIYFSLSEILMYLRAESVLVSGPQPLLLPRSRHRARTVEMVTTVAMEAFAFDLRQGWRGDEEVGGTARREELVSAGEAARVDLSQDQVI